MRHNITLRLPTFFEALQKLGYYKLQPRRTPSLEWRRRDFHIILRPAKTKVKVNLHIDVPVYSTIGKPHKSRQDGKDINKEWKNILQEYKRLRAKKSASTDSHIA